MGLGGDTSSAPHIHIHSPLRRRAVGAVGWGGWRRAGSWKSLPADWRPRCHGDRPGGASRAAARAGDVTRPAPAGLGRPRLRRGAGVRGGEEGGEREAVRSRSSCAPKSAFWGVFGGFRAQSARHELAGCFVTRQEVRVKQQSQLISPKGSQILALVSHYCNFSANKGVQL